MSAPSHHSPHAAATLAVLEQQAPSLLRLERQENKAAARLIDHEGAWAWFAGRGEEERRRAATVDDRTCLSVCHTAARDGADSLLLELRQEGGGGGGGGTAWRLVELDKIKGCEDVLPAKAARDSAVALINRAVAAEAGAAGDETVLSLGIEDVRDAAALRATLREVLGGCSFTVPVALAPDGTGGAHQSRGELRGCLAGGKLAEQILLAIERGFFAHAADVAAEELLREECANASGARHSTGGRKGGSKRRGSNAKRKQREKESSGRSNPQKKAECLSLAGADHESLAPEPEPEPEVDLEERAKQAREARVAGFRGKLRVEPMATGLLRQLGADVTEMAGALAAIQDKRRPWELGVVEMIRSEVHRLFRSIGQSVKCEIVGSASTHLGVPGSGVDLALCVDEAASQQTAAAALSCSPHKPVHMKKKTTDAAAELAKRLGNAQWVDSVELDQSSGARVPVVNIVCANSAMKVSVLFEISGIGQKGRVLETTKLMGGLAQDFPALRPLTLVLKQLLVERGLNDPYSGGLSSFALVLLIAFVLQRRRVRNGSDVDEDLGAALEEFLRFFGEEFDPATQGISIQKWDCFPLSATGKASTAVDDGGGISAPARDPLTIEDPTNIFNNVGHSCSGVAALQRVLADALTAIANGEKEACEGSSVLGRMFGDDDGTHHMKVVELVKRTWCPPERPDHVEELASPRSEARAEAHATANSLLAGSAEANLRHRFEISAPRQEPELSLRDIHDVRASILDSSTAAVGTAPHGAANQPGELHANVLDMASSLMRIQEKRRPWQLAVVDRVRAIVGMLWPMSSRAAPHGAWVEMYGSLATGLDTPSSDVDLVVRGVALELCWGHLATAHEQLAAALTMEGWDEVKVIGKTTVPVIKVVSGGGLISVDISFDGPAHRGLHTATYVRYMVTTHAGLHPLTVVLKQLLVERGLNDPYSGGLSSFALVLLIAFVLQRRRVRNGSDVDEDLGAALEEFLRFFGEEFEPATQGISMQRGCFTLPCALPSATDDDGGGISGISAPARDPLTIEDPTNSTNNVGRTCFGVALLRSTLSDARSFLGAANGRDTAGAGATTLGRLFKTTHHAQVVDLVRRTWCPADPQLVLPVEAELISESLPYAALRRELEALKAERDAWESRATRAEKQVAQLTARLVKQEHQLGHKSGGTGQDAIEKSIEKGSWAERFAETLAMQHP